MLLSRSSAAFQLEFIGVELVFYRSVSDCISGVAGLRLGDEDAID